MTADLKSIKRLAAAVIVRAYRDALNKTGDLPDYQRRYYREDALDFFSSDRCKYWLSICDLDEKHFKMFEKLSKVSA